MPKLLNSKFKIPKWLFFILLLVFVLRIPSFFEPYSYGDEMIYLTLGNAIRRGVQLYSEIHDNKPPMLYLFAAFSENLFWFKALLTGWSLATIFAFWKLTFAFFKSGSERPSKELINGRFIAVCVFSLLTTIPLLEGNIVNSELFMIGPTILGFMILLKAKNSTLNLLIAGLLFAVSALFKIPAAFDIPAIIVYWFVTERNLDKNTIIGIFKKTFILAIGFLIPIVLTFIWYYLAGSLKEYIVAAFLQNFGYLSSWRPDDIQKPFLTKNGPLLVRAAIVALGSVVLFILRKKLSKEFIFATLWLLFTLFAVTLSERPYPHYLIQSIAPLSILTAMFFVKQNIEQVFTIIPLFLALLAPVYYKFWYYPSFPYYVNFAKLVGNKITNDEYLSAFGGQVPRNYRIARFITSSSKPTDKVFVWGDSAAIYALSRRLPPGKYVADYHIKDFSTNEETIQTLNKDMPAFIVILQGSKPFPELDYLIIRNYGIALDVEGSQIWKLLNPKVRALFSY